ncbi:hypothetical protein SISNIDRAFT_492552 [Sistotremastrum niveocremeum HHB9708]|uniref:Uncharacterized protein n=1 Tax=Sistotremastrum niveocremeum HHB9708 TaxID=1314777 RepID=A0A164ZW34_9AGAM|nr:hypothetical protein SISNIDRAFT_492552 [Sistotremastrum niveocremeum HHB9708]
MAGWLRKPDSAVVVSAVTFLVILIDKVYGHLGPRTSGFLGLLGISAIRSLSDVWTVAQLWRSFENFESSSFNAWTPPERHRIDLDRLEEICVNDRILDPLFPGKHTDSQGTWLKHDDNPGTTDSLSCLHPYYGHHTYRRVRLKLIPAGLYIIVWLFNSEWSSWKGDTVAFSVLLELSQILIYLLVRQRRSFFYTNSTVYAFAKPDRYLE